MHKISFLLAAAWAIGLSACGSDDSTTGGQGGTTGSGGSGGATTGTSSGGATGSGGSTTASGGSGGAGGATTTTTGSGGADVQCAGENPYFPTFGKTCTSQDQCAVAIHQINCCGTRAAIGILAADSAAFAAAEATCEAQYPQCGCAQFPTKAEDGDTTTDESLIQVDCLAGSCSTFVP